jgi:hypothetical protein
MASVSFSRFFRTCLALFFVSAALFVGGYGVSLLVEAFDGHGSPGGNFLLIGLGLFLLGLSLIVLVIGVSMWTLAHPT